MLLTTKDPALKAEQARDGQTSNAHKALLWLASSAAVVVLTYIH